MLLTFQAALWPLQKPHKHSYSLCLAIHFPIGHHYVQKAKQNFLLKFQTLKFKVE